jgi:hypothetical protein
MFLGVADWLIVSFLDDLFDLTNKLLLNIDV